MFSGKPDKSLTWTRESADNVVLYGKHALVVGGTGGIGQALARLMAKQGADVTVMGRSFRDTGTPGLHFVQADLDSMADAFVELMLVLLEEGEPEVTADEPSTLAGLPGRRIVIEALGGEDTDVPVRMVMIMAMHGEDLIMVAAGLPLDTFEDEWPAFGEVINSIQFIE